jgi:hypothetical protein
MSRRDFSSGIGPAIIAATVRAQGGPALRSQLSGSLVRVDLRLGLLGFLSHSGPENHEELAASNVAQQTMMPVVVFKNPPTGDPQPSPIW